MTRHQSIGRRSVLRAAGSIALTNGLAGCQLDEYLSERGPKSENGPKNIESWLSDAHYHGPIDKTGTKSVTVDVGPEKEEYGPPPTSGNETRQQSLALGENSFVPAAIKISPGTEVTWKWITSPDDNDSSWRNNHNVVATNEQFDSGEPKPSGTYKHTLELAGTHYYYCEPHKSNGMKGVVVVAESASPEGTPRQ